MPTYITGSNYLNSPEVLPIHAETAQLCIPIVAGQVNPACDDLVFILSVEFFGQVYREFIIVIYQYNYITSLYSL